MYSVWVSNPCEKKVNIKISIVIDVEIKIIVKSVLKNSSCNDTSAKIKIRTHIKNGETSSKVIKIHTDVRIRIGIDRAIIFARYVSAGLDFLSKKRFKLFICVRDSIACRFVSE